MIFNLWPILIHLCLYSLLWIILKQGLDTQNLINVFQ